MKVCRPNVVLYSLRVLSHHQDILDYEDDMSIFPSGSLRTLSLYRLLNIWRSLITPIRDRLQGGLTSQEKYMVKQSLFAMLSKLNQELPKKHNKIKPSDGGKTKNETQLLGYMTWLATHYQKMPWLLKIKPKSNQSTTHILRLLNSHQRPQMIPRRTSSRRRRTWLASTIARTERTRIRNKMRPPAQFLEREHSTTSTTDEYLYNISNS